MLKTARDFILQDQFKLQNSGLKDIFIADVRLGPQPDNAYSKSCKYEGFSASNCTGFKIGKGEEVLISLSYAPDFSKLTDSAKVTFISNATSAFQFNISVFLPTSYNSENAYSHIQKPQVREMATRYLGDPADYSPHINFTESCKISLPSLIYGEKIHNYILAGFSFVCLMISILAILDGRAWFFESIQSTFTLRPNISENWLKNVYHPKLGPLGCYDKEHKSTILTHSTTSRNSAITPSVYSGSTLRNSSSNDTGRTISTDSDVPGKSKKSKKEKNTTPLVQVPEQSDEQPQLLRRRKKGKKEKNPPVSAFKPIVRHRAYSNTSLSGTESVEAFQPVIKGNKGKNRPVLVQKQENKQDPSRPSSVSSIVSLKKDNSKESTPTGSVKSVKLNVKKKIEPPPGLAKPSLSVIVPDQTQILLEKIKLEHEITRASPAVREDIEINSPEDVEIKSEIKMPRQPKLPTPIKEIPSPLKIPQQQINPVYDIFSSHQIDDAIMTPTQSTYQSEIGSNGTLSGRSTPDLKSPNVSAVADMSVFNPNRIKTGDTPRIDFSKQPLNIIGQERDKNTNSPLSKINSNLTNSIFSIDWSVLPEQKSADEIELFRQKSLGQSVFQKGHNRKPSESVPINGVENLINSPFNHTNEKPAKSPDSEGDGEFSHSIFTMKPGSNNGFFNFDDNKSMQLALESEDNISLSEEIAKQSKKSPRGRKSKKAKKVDSKNWNVKSKEFVPKSKQQNIDDKKFVVDGKPTDLDLEKVKGIWEK